MKSCTAFIVPLAQPSELQVLLQFTKLIALHLLCCWQLAGHLLFSCISSKVLKVLV